MSEPTDDRIVWFEEAPERSPITSFNKNELIGELSKREGVTLFEIPKCDNVGFIKGEATILVIRK